MKYKFIYFIEFIIAKTIIIINFNEFDESQILEKKFVNFEESKTNVSF